MHEKWGGIERSLSLFKTPFEQSLSPDTRWVKMASLVPWDEMAKVFFDSLSERQGRLTVCCGLKWLQGGTGVCSGVVY
jgi:hypothetical protein